MISHEDSIIKVMIFLVNELPHTRDFSCVRLHINEAELDTKSSASYVLQYQLSNMFLCVFQHHHPIHIIFPEFFVIYDRIIYVNSYPWCNTGVFSI